MSRPSITTRATSLVAVFVSGRALKPLTSFSASRDGSLKDVDRGDPSSPHDVTGSPRCVSGGRRARLDHVPTLPFPDDVRELLRRPLPAVMATLRSDGMPVTVATWYLLEDDDRVLVNMDHSRVRVKHLRRDPRVSLTALAADWYTHVSLTGRVVEMADDEGLAGIDRLSQHYRGRPYTNRISPRVSAWIEVERWQGWGATRSKG